MDATYINFTLPETGTKAWNKNIKCDERLYTWKLVWLRARSSFLPSRIWAFGVSSHSQSHKLQRLKWHPRWKDHVLHWMDKVIYELQAALMRGKIMLCGIKASGTWCSTHVLSVFPTNKHENMARYRSMLVLYPVLPVLPTHALFVNWLSR